MAKKITLPTNSLLGDWGMGRGGGDLEREGKWQIT